MNMTTSHPTRSDAGLATALRISVSRLARRLRAERYTAGLEPNLSDTQLAALEERGLIRRAPHATDRRQVVLTATPQGRTVVEQSRQLREAWLALQLRELTQQELATLRAAAPILEKLSQS